MKRRAHLWLLCGLCFYSAGCDDDAATTSNPMPDASNIAMDGTPPPQPMDMAMLEMDMMTVMAMDMGVVEDMQVIVPMDQGPLPDVGPLNGPACDPRLNARACDPGFFCVHIPGQRPNVGACQEGDRCEPGVDGSCPPERPYCHLKGGATVCSEFGELTAGQDCVDANQIPQPCAEGLVCNNSVCQEPCIPGQENECPDDGRCADISERTGVPSGLCGPRNCNWFTGEGCEANEKCSYAIRSDGVLVGSCTPLDGAGNLDQAPCTNLPTGGDNCAQGLVCIGPPGREKFCLRMCDTGQYEAPCPGTMACEERLQTVNGRVRGFGLCVTNQ